MLATSILQTPPPLVHTMLERALAAGVPATWVTGDAGYGHDRTWRLGMASWPQAYVMAVPVNEPVWRGFQQLRVPWLIARARGQRLAAPERRGRGQGAAAIRRGSDPRPPLPPGWCRWGLARCSLEAPTDLAYDVDYAPESTPLVAMVRAAGSR